VGNKAKQAAPKNPTPAATRTEQRGRGKLLAAEVLTPYLDSFIFKKEMNREAAEKQLAESNASDGTFLIRRKFGGARRERFDFTPMGGQCDFVWLPTRTPRVGPQYAW